MNALKELRIILIAINDELLSDTDYEATINQNVKYIKEVVGQIHGKNALKIFGSEIVSCKTEIDRSENGYAAVTIDCSVPNGTCSSDMFNVICSHWMKLPLASSEVYEL